MLLTRLGLVVGHINADFVAHGAPNDQGLIEAAC